MTRAASDRLTPADIVALGQGARVFRCRCGGFEVRMPGPPPAPWTRWLALLGRVPPARIWRAVQESRDAVAYGVPLDDARVRALVAQSLAPQDWIDLKLHHPRAAAQPVPDLVRVLVAHFGERNERRLLRLWRQVPSLGDSTPDPWVARERWGPAFVTGILSAGQLREGLCKVPAAAGTERAAARRY